MRCLLLLLLESNPEFFVFLTGSWARSSLSTWGSRPLGAPAPGELYIYIYIRGRTDRLSKWENDLRLTPSSSSLSEASPQRPALAMVVDEYEDCEYNTRFQAFEYIFPESLLLSLSVCIKPCDIVFLLPQTNTSAHTHTKGRVRFGWVYFNIASAVASSSSSVRVLY